MYAKWAAVWFLAGMTFPALAVSCFSIDDLNPEYRDCPNRQAWYPDADGDGAGDPSEVWVTCDEPTGFVPVAGDCDDQDPTVQTCPDSGDTGADSGDTGADSGDTGADSGETTSGVAFNPRHLPSLFPSISRLFQVLSR
jgi:hypothetical protein